MYVHSELLKQYGGLDQKRFEILLFKLSEHALNKPNTCLIYKRNLIRICGGVLLNFDFEVTGFESHNFPVSAGHIHKSKTMSLLFTQKLEKLNFLY